MTSVAIPATSFLSISLSLFSFFSLFCQKPKWSLITEWPLLLFQPRLWLVVASLPNSFQLCCRIQYIPIWYNHVLYFFVYFFYVQKYFTLRYVTQYLLGCVRLTQLSLPLLLHFEYQYYFNIDYDISDEIEIVSFKRIFNTTLCFRRFTKFNLALLAHSVLA